MNKVIVYTQEDGTVAICTPSGEIPIEDVLAKDCPPHAIIVDKDVVPIEHLVFHGAWELDNGEININLEKAKEITKDRLREERLPLLQAQDIAFQIALETEADTKAIVVEKQRLRDVTLLADQATSLEELRIIKA